MLYKKKLYHSVQVFLFIGRLIQLFLWFPISLKSTIFIVLCCTIKSNSSFVGLHWVFYFSFGLPWFHWGIGILGTYQQLGCGNVSRGLVAALDVALGSFLANSITIFTTTAYTILIYFLFIAFIFYLLTSKLSFIFAIKLCSLPDLFCVK